MERPKLIILILAMIIAFLTVAQELYVSMKSLKEIARAKTNAFYPLDGKRCMID